MDENTKPDEEKEEKEQGPPPRRERCYCGIDVDDANRLCTERDCPYKR